MLEAETGPPICPPLVHSRPWPPAATRGSAAPARPTWRSTSTSGSRPGMLPWPIPREFGDRLRMLAEGRRTVGPEDLIRSTVSPPCQTPPMATYKINYTASGEGPDSIEAESAQLIDKAGGWIVFLGYNDETVLALKAFDVKSYQRQ